MQNSLYFLEEYLIQDLVAETAPTKQQILTLIECRLSYWPGCYLQVEGSRLGIFDDLLVATKPYPRKAALLLFPAVEAVCQKKWENVTQFACGLYLLQCLAKASIEHEPPEGVGDRLLKIKEIGQRLLAEAQGEDITEELLSFLLNWYGIE
ncbi:MAG TPA: hypothetical protein DDW93_00725 [Firmicutes bacterium]|nr:hypothetical protein [Bacillota bacterium]HBT18045.1 hypothetical protein [Bacillota bacterium]